MASKDQEDPYLLSYRRNEVDESHRLDSQHDVIKHAILGGQLIHPSIPTAQITGAIADLGCGTGIWLDDVYKTVLSDVNDSVKLIGFDVNARAFNQNPAPGVQLVEHDCTKPFDAIYIGQFDLVNMRGLAYALSVEGFSMVIENAYRLLRPGGYLQWLETETRLFKAYPETPEISEALNAINVERQQCQLAPYLPHYMLRQILSPKLDLDDILRSEVYLTIINFNLLPGGFSREGQSKELLLNDRFSEIVLESMQLLLKASLIRQEPQTATVMLDRKVRKNEDSQIQNLIVFIEGIRKSKEIKMGGFFPQLIARKSATHD